VVTRRSWSTKSVCLSFCKGSSLLQYRQWKSVTLLTDLSPIPVSTWMGDHVRAFNSRWGKYISVHVWWWCCTSHPRQLILLATRPP